jgi:putative spermidine/putrescine transport system ATP-binding protein
MAMLPHADRLPAAPGAECRLADPEDRFLEISGVQKLFDTITVLGGISMSVRRGEFVSLLGPSGCGKTTLLRIVAGLASPDAGRIVLDSADITRMAPNRRDVSFVFQSYALFPHLSVRDNVAFGLRARGASNDRIAPAVARYLSLVQMEAFADRSIKSLSGGQQQRVAVARALVVQPKLILLDEPLSALDRKLREAMQIDLKRLLRDVGITAIFVTHDQDEALMMSDRIALMHRGFIEQFAEPATIYRRPATPFVLDFVGLSTTLAGTVRQSSAGEIVVETALGRIRAPGDYRSGASVLLGVRPERIMLASVAGQNSAHAILKDVAFQGARVQLYFDAPAGQRILVEAADLPAGARPGVRLPLSWSLEDTLVFPA